MGGEARVDYERRQKGIQQTIAKYKGERDVLKKKLDISEKERDAFAKKRDDAVAKAMALQKRIAELEAQLNAQSQNDSET